VLTVQDSALQLQTLGVILGKWFGGFAERTDVPAVAKSSGNGVICCLKIFVARVCVRTVVTELVA
jgi:hypothetical protein